jgi:pyrimidine-specific ribonucleoside hydrolase
MSRARVSRRHLLLDVDTGIDDALAIAFAVAHPSIQLRAITCVEGNVGVEQVVDNTLRLLDLLQAPDIPVAAGANRPLTRSPSDASHVHGRNGMADLMLPAARRTRSKSVAIDETRTLLSSADRPITYVSLAPMTNLALLLRADPDVSFRIDRIVFMGGAIAGGNATAAAEYNVWHDPEAAHIVLNSGIPITMYPLDVFNAATVSPQEIDEFAGADTEIERAIAALLSFRDPTSTDQLAGPFGLLGDAGVVCAIAHPDSVQRRRYRVQVDTAGGKSRGQTYVDRRARPGEDEIHNQPLEWPWIEVIERVDPAPMKDLFFSTIRQYASTTNRDQVHA